MWCCTFNPEFFINAANGNAQAVRAQLDEMKGRFDLRPTKPKDGVYGGFGAIHYAALNGKLSTFKELLRSPEEVILVTRREVSLNGAEVANCPAKTTALGVAIIAEKISIVEAFLDHLCRNREDLDEYFSLRGAEQMSDVIIASLANNSTTKLVLKNELFFSQLLDTVGSDFNPLVIAATFGYPAVATCIFELLNDDQSCAIACKLALSHNSKNQLPFQIEPVKNSCNSEGKQISGECNQIIRKITELAVDYISRSVDASLRAFVYENKSILDSLKHETDENTHIDLINENVSADI